MRRYRLLIVFLFLLSLLSAIPSAPNRTDAQGRRQGEWVVLLDLSWNPTTVADDICYYRMISYKNGVPSGIVRTYTKLGRKRFEGYLSAESPIVFGDGPAVFYDDFGKTTSQGNYKSGQKTGLWKEWFENGEHAQGNYIDGQPQGKWDFYDSEDHLIATGSYLDGEREGFWQEFDADQTHREGTYHLGKYTGKWIFYHPNGKRESEGQYIDGKPDGIWTFWNEEGALLGTVRYILGERAE